MSQPDDNNDDAEEQQEDYLVHDKHRSDMLSFTFPSSVVFNIASVDAQHTVWEVPDALSGKEYISLLGRRHWDYYFKTLNVTTLYWNYDLHSIINKYIPKHQEQARRSSAKLSTEFSTNRLLGKSRDIISDTHLTTEWSYVTNDRDARNTVAKYVGGNAAHFSVQQGKTLIINSEYMKDEDKVHVTPQLYTRDNEGPIKRLPMIDRKNQYAEGEGASFFPAVRFHENENCLIVSNDTNAVIYGILAGLQRNAQGDFLGQLWVQIVYLQSKTGVMGVKKGKASEFWNINMLIYNIELKLSLTSQSQIML